MAGCTVIRIGIAFTAGYITKIADLVMIILVLPVRTPGQAEVGVVGQVEPRVAGSALAV